MWKDHAKAAFFAFQVYIINILFVLDVALNVLIGGDRRETVSSRLGKGVRQGKPVHSALAAVVDFFAYFIEGEWDHCRRNILPFRDRFSVSTAYKKGLISDFKL